jgi:hypothetical protein
MDKNVNFYFLEGSDPFCLPLVPSMSIHLYSKSSSKHKKINKLIKIDMKEINKKILKVMKYI